MIFIWDLDGTITDPSPFLHYVKTSPKNWDAWDANLIHHKPHWDMVELFKHHYEVGHTNIIVTARSERCRPITFQWLKQHGIDHMYDAMYMRGMKDFRPDYEVKLDILNNLRHNNIHPDFAFEDRGSVIEMYRENGVRCFQVINGEH
jgi:hypothetical protein